MIIVRAILKRKLLLAVIIIAIIIGGYFIYGKIRGQNTTTRYVLGRVEKGTLIVSVTGSGQVATSNQLDIKPKVSAQIIKVYVQAGQNVKTGQVLAQLDSTEAQKTVRDAQINLETARLAMEKLQTPPDELALLQAKNALTQAQQALTQAESALQKSYDDGFNAVANAFLSLPNIMTGLNNALYSKTFYSEQSNMDYIYDSLIKLNPNVGVYKIDADTAYQTARKNYDQNFLDYKATSRYAKGDALEALINQTYDTVKAIAQAVKDANDLLTFYEDQLTVFNKKIPSQTDAYLADLNGYTASVNTALGNLLSAQTALNNAKNIVINNRASVEEKTQSLAKLQAGPDTLDIKTQQLSLQKSQNALTDAQSALANYTIRAPFDGVVAKVNQKVGDQASSGTTLATLVTTQELATINLNEVDAAKVKIGQKATLTFDAIDGLSITGQVAEIDSLGTVSSGVVTYSTTIAFDTQDNRVKPGMSVSASIITEVKPEVLLVDNSAVQGTVDSRYVETLSNPSAGEAALALTGVTSNTAPQRKAVTVGLANDTQTEIVSGLSEGDLVITRVITNNTTAASQNSNSLLPGLNTGRGTTRGTSSGGGVFFRTGN